MKKIINKINLNTIIFTAIVLIIPVILFSLEVYFNTFPYSFLNLYSYIWPFIIINIFGVIAFDLSFRRKYRLNPRWYNYISIIIVNLAILYIYNSLFFLFNERLNKSDFGSYPFLFVFFNCLVTYLFITPQLEIEKVRKIKNYLNLSISSILSNPQNVFLIIFLAGFFSLINVTFVYIVMIPLMIVYTYFCKIFLTHFN